MCYALIGQIVNRGLQLLRNQPTGVLVVNSPIEAPSLVEKVKDDWGNGEAETLRTSLLADIDVADSMLDIDVIDPEQFKESIYVKQVVNPALQRLRTYFPDAYKSLAGNRWKRKAEFENEETAQRSPSTR